MSGHVFIVPAMSAADIDAYAARLTKQLVDVGMPDGPRLPVMDVLENIMANRFDLFELRVGSREEMGDAEGLTCLSGEFIELREDVYQRACNDVPRDRFTAMHELGHRALHSGQSLARMAAGDRTTPAYRQSEWQADYFAATMLMPAKYFSASDTVEEVMQRHGVSAKAAENRLKYLKRKGVI